MRSFYKVPKVREDAQGWPFYLQKRRERAIRSKCCSRGQLRHLITPDILNRPAGDIAYFITLVLHYYINSSCYTFRSCIFRYFLQVHKCIYYTHLPTLLVTALVLSTKYLLIYILTQINKNYSFLKTRITRKNIYIQKCFI